MRLIEVVAEDPRAAFWRADGSPVSAPCLAALVEPRQAAGIIHALHDALPAATAGVAHVKRCRRGDDGRLRVILATEALFASATQSDAYGGRGLNRRG